MIWDVMSEKDMTKDMVIVFLLIMVLVLTLTLGNSEKSLYECRDVSGVGPQYLFEAKDNALHTDYHVNMSGYYQIIGKR